jgi:hypothetical protein
MSRRASTIAGLLAAVAALLLAAGLVPAAADPPKDIVVSPRDNSIQHKAPDKVVVTYSDVAPEDTSITVEDACERTISAKRTIVSGRKALVGVNKGPRGRYRVRVRYTVVAEPEPDPSESPSPEPSESPSPEPSETPPPEEKTEKWGYSFKVHAGPACDGSDDNHGKKKQPKKYSWGSTTDSSHHGGNHAASSSNPITAGSTTHSGYTGSPTSATSYSPNYTPFYDGRGSTTDNTTHSALPDFESGFGDSAFESTPEDSQLSDPTDPLLASPEPEVIAPEEADDEQSLSAAPTDTLEPESGVLVVALAAALLLGAGGGLFLRKADPARARK